MSTKIKTVKLATMRSNVALLSNIESLTEKDKIGQLSMMYQAKAPDGIDTGDKIVKWNDLKWIDVIPAADRAEIDANAIMTENEETLKELSDLILKATEKRDLIADLLSEVGYTLPVIPTMNAISAHAGGGTPLKRLYEVGKTYKGVSVSTTGLYGIRVDALNGEIPSKCTIVHAESGETIRKAGVKAVHVSFPAAAREIVTGLVGRSLPKTGGLNAPREFGVPLQSDSQVLQSVIVRAETLKDEK